jgi:hypothetical protein
VREVFVTEVMPLIEAHYIPSQRLPPGQRVWYAVDKTDRPHHGRRSVAKTRLVPVTLTLVAREDKVRRHVVVWLHREADAQNGVLAEIDPVCCCAKATGRSATPSGL